MRTYREELIALVKEAKEVHALERDVTLKSLMLIGKLDARYASSNMGMTVQNFAAFIGLTVDQYLKRAQAARMIGFFPETKAMLEAGELRISHLAAISSRLTHANRKMVFEHIKGKSKREVMQFMSRVTPEGTLLDKEETQDLRLTLTKSQIALVDRAREVLAAGGKVPGLAEIITKALEDLLFKRDPLRKAERDAAREERKWRKKHAASKKQEQVNTMSLTKDADADPSVGNEHHTCMSEVYAPAQRPDPCAVRAAAEAETYAPVQRVDPLTLRVAEVTEVYAPAQRPDLLTVRVPEATEAYAPAQGAAPREGPGSAAPEAYAPAQGPGPCADRVAEATETYAPAQGAEPREGPVSAAPETYAPAQRPDPLTVPAAEEAEAYAPEQGAEPRKEPVSALPEAYAPAQGPDRCTIRVAKAYTSAQGAEPRKAPADTADNAHAPAQGPDPCAIRGAAEAEAHAPAQGPEPRKEPVTTAPEAHAPAQRVNTGGRKAVPAHVRHVVWLRDEGTCTFRYPDQTRCGEKMMLELDHITMVCRGGENTAENLTLKCRMHNQAAAAASLGEAWYARKVDGRRWKAGAPRESSTSA